MMRLVQALNGIDKPKLTPPARRRHSWMELTACEWAGVQAIIPETVFQEPLINSVRPEPFDFAQESLVEG